MLMRPRLNVRSLISTLLSIASLAGVATAQAPLRVGGDIPLPKRLSQVSPVYPPGARQMWVEGLVRLEIVIDSVGAVSEVRVVRSIPMLDQAAQHAVRQWTYEPTLIDGTPVPVTMKVDVRFSLSDVNALMRAARDGDLDLTKRALSSGIDVNAAANDRTTALHVAARDGHGEIVALLLEAGAKPDARDSEGETPLMEAAAGGHLEIVEALLKAGADETARARRGATALELARAAGHTDIVRRLDAGHDSGVSSEGKEQERKLLRLADAGPGELQPPRLKTSVKPAYTDSALDRRVEGVVVLEVVVLRDGTVGDVRVSRSLDRGLDQEAVEAVRRWRFEPGRYRDHPVDVMLEIDVAFTLK